MPVRRLWLHMPPCWELVIWFWGGGGGGKFYTQTVTLASKVGVCGAGGYCCLTGRDLSLPSCRQVACAELKLHCCCCYPTGRGLRGPVRCQAACAEQERNGCCCYPTGRGLRLPSRRQASESLLCAVGPPTLGSPGGGGGGARHSSEGGAPGGSFPGQKARQLPHDTWDGHWGRRSGNFWRWGWTHR